MGNLMSLCVTTASPDYKQAGGGAARALGDRSDEYLYRVVGRRPLATPSPATELRACGCHTADLRLFALGKGLRSCGAFAFVAFSPS